jgi:hypothetical protein
LQTVELCLVVVEFPSQKVETFAEKIHVLLDLREHPILTTVQVGGRQFFQDLDGNVGPILTVQTVRG